MLGIMRPPRRRADARSSKVCQLLGGDCGAFGKDFYEVGSISPKAGEAVVVTLDDPVNFGSDTRTLGMIWDDSIVETVARQDEGTTKGYVITQVKGQRLTLWLDADNVATAISVVPRGELADEVAKNERTAFDDLLDGVDKERKRQQDLMNNILIGLGVIVVVGLVAAAYALANTKINPNISIIPGS